jgi:YCII-related domain
MIDYILFMHDDAPAGTDAEWEKYLSRLRDSGHFAGGSAIGDGICVNKKGSSPPISARLTGYIRVQAKSLDDAQRFLEGNPVYEAGGTIEIRALPRN